MSEVNWYYVVSIVGECGYMQMKDDDVAKIKEETGDTITMAEPPKNLTGWRMIIMPEASFNKMVGLDKV